VLAATDAIVTLPQPPTMLKSGSMAYFQFLMEIRQAALNSPRLIRCKGSSEKGATHGFLQEMVIV
jgi:hypothetical protein